MPDITMRGTGSYELNEGDTILVGVTHEISVGRDKSWVKYEATTKVRPTEVADDARARAVRHVKESVDYTVAAVIEDRRAR